MFLERGALELSVSLPGSKLPVIDVRAVRPHAVRVQCIRASEQIRPSILILSRRLAIFEAQLPAVAPFGLISDQAADIEQYLPGKDGIAHGMGVVPKLASGPVQHSQADRMVQRWRCAEFDQRAGHEGPAVAAGQRRLAVSVVGIGIGAALAQHPHEPG